MPLLHHQLTSTGKLIDDALEAVEKGNPRNCDLRIASSSSPRMAIGTSPLTYTFTRDQHPDLSFSRHSAALPDADFVMALPSAAACSLPRSNSADRPNGRIHPPFNIKEWWDSKLDGDARWN